jgi:hypothetical protein
MDALIRTVDSFYETPETVREFALGSEYVPAWGSWDGLHSLERARDTRERLFQIAGLVSPSPPNWEEIDASYRFWRKAACGGFAALFNGQFGVTHSHRRSGDWAGVVYMSLPEHCAGRSGTQFYRHRKTGLELLDGTECEEAVERIRSDARNFDAWEETHSVPMAFNRLVVFDSRYFHRPSPGFGNTIADCRLVQVFNFCTK